MRIQLDTFDLIIRRIFFIYREIITDLADQCRLDKMLNISWIHTHRILAWLCRTSKRLAWTRRRSRSTACKISCTWWKGSSRDDRSRGARNSCGRTRLNSWIPFYGWTISKTWTSSTRCTVYYKSGIYNAERDQKSISLSLKTVKKNYKI